MADPRLGFGLLGAGLIAPLHAKALQASTAARLVGIADLNPQRLAKLTAEFGCPGYASLDEMLQNPEVEAVSVLTPNHLHFEAVAQIAAAGRHVLVEKPPAMSLRELDEMERLCHDAGVQIGVVLQCRVRKAVQAMKTALAQGRFGKVLHADTYMKWYRSEDYYFLDAWRSSRRSGAGVTVQHAFHYLDLLQYLVGPVASVYAQMTNLAHPQVELEDTLLAFVKYQNGAQGVVEASTALWPGTDIRLEVNGTAGTAIMSGERMVTWKFQEERPEDEKIRQYGSTAVATGATGPTDLAFADHQVVIDNLAAAAQGGAEPLIPLRSVRPTLEWALAMYCSARQNQWVTLPLASEDNIW